MKTRIYSAVAAMMLCFFTVSVFSQAPSLGTAAGFVLFTSVGAVTNSGISQVTGNVGTNSGSTTGFGNVNGMMHDNDGATAQCSADLLTAYNQLNSAIPSFFPASLLGNGQSFIPGIYSISAAATLNADLILNAQGDANALFIIQVQGAFATSAGSRVLLANGAQACNVFWKVEGMVNMAPGTTMRGTVIANNAAISLNTGDTLEGRALSTSGAVSVDGVMTFTPIGCNMPLLTGPPAPVMGSAGCYALFSSDGSVSNTGVTRVTGDVGTNTGLTTGFDAQLVAGTIHPVPDASTAQCAANLLTLYNNLNILPYDILLLYPAQFGNNLVLTPHTYLLDAATELTGSVYLNAQGNPDAVFVIRINGALSTGTYARVRLINGTQAKNVFWKVEGAVNLNDYTAFSGMIICNNGSMTMNQGLTIDGRAMTTTGALTTNAVTAAAPAIPSNCTSVGLQSQDGQTISNPFTLYPNPFSTSVTIRRNDASMAKGTKLVIYTISGEVVLTRTITRKTTTVRTGNLATGIYFYRITGNGRILQSGRLLSKQ